MLAKILKHLRCFIARILMKIGGLSVHKKSCRMMAF